ncbi:hypothetical protein GC209_17735 [bacterium]|nr:hypothetical protein [bacterium]
MAALIWGGAVVALLGVAGLARCVSLSMAAKRADPDTARALMQRVVTLNLASMGVAILGLICVVAGLVLR